MRIELKGLYWTYAVLADGTKKFYYYAWKNGPRLAGEYGSPEFVASFNAAVVSKVAAPEGRLLAALQGYQKSTDFTGLSARTQRDYIKHITKIEQKFGDMPLKATERAETRGIFMDWRDELAKASVRQAEYTWTVLALVLAWAKNRGRIRVNPCEKGGRIYHGTRIDHVWTADDIDTFLKGAPSHLALAFMLALWTGQREGDLLRLTWFAYDGTNIRLKPSKSRRRGGRPVSLKIKVGAPLKAVLDAASKVKRGSFILTNSDGDPWTEDGFRSSFFKRRDKLGIVGVTFNDLRGTAVTRLAIAGCEVPEIGSITGHSLKDVHAILDAHYLHRDPRLAEQAISKLEARFAQGEETALSAIDVSK
jgi:integrase